MQPYIVALFFMEIDGERNILHIVEGNTNLVLFISSNLN
jgi:hypothetical protein